MKSLALITSFLIMTSLAFAAVYRVPTNFTSLQDAINAAVVGDTVLVDPGTYNENIDFQGKAITLQSSGGHAVTVINGNGLGSVVQFVSGEGPDSVLDGFTITNGTGTTNGSATMGGGIYCNGASPTLINNKITLNKITTAATEIKGGGIALFDSYALVSNNLVSENECGTLDDACILTGCGIYIFGGAPEIRNNDIVDNKFYNHAFGSTSKGNGIYCFGSTGLIQENLIARNLSNKIRHTFGGGISCEASTPIIHNNMIRDNQCNGSEESMGGGLHSNYATLFLTENTFSGNSVSTVIDAPWNRSYLCGGGVYLRNAILEMHNNRITENRVLSLDGPPVSFSSAHGGGIYAAASQGLMKDNTIDLNTVSGDPLVTSGGGGGVFCAGLDNLEIKENFIEKNLSDLHGGGIATTNTTAVIFENLIRENTAGQNGGGIYGFGTGKLLIKKNILYMNESVYLGGGVYCEGTSLGFLNNLIFRNEAKSGAAICLKESLVAGDNTARIVNNTICSNEATDIAGGIYTWMYVCDIKNSIIWGNRSNSPYHNLRLFGAFEVTYCDVEGGYPGDGNISDNPLFVDLDAGDYHLTGPSPCINRGLNDEAPVDDSEGVFRPFMGTVDLGAHEYTGIHRLKADQFTLSTALGGVILFTLTGGQENGGRLYCLLSGFSGTVPGIAMPGGTTTLPLNWDHFTNHVMIHLNINWFGNFLAPLDSQGNNQAQLQIQGPMNSGLIGKVVYFAYCLEGDPAWNFVSNPIAVEIIL